MKKLILVGGLVVVAIACSSGADMLGEILDSGVPDAGAQPGTSGKFVGYTSEAYRLSTNSSLEGVGGLFNTYAACRSDFGATARVCTVTEVLGTADLPPPPPAGDGNTVTDGAWMLATLDQAPSCWQSSGGNAPVILPNGEFYTDTNCDRWRVLACCTTN